ncbi:unnamed protein product, partial [Didymodactylos carnosus]
IKHMNAGSLGHKYLTIKSVNENDIYKRQTRSKRHLLNDIVDDDETTTEPVRRHTLDSTRSAFINHDAVPGVSSISYGGTPMGDRIVRMEHRLPNNSKFANEDGKIIRLDSKKCVVFMCRSKLCHRRYEQNVSQTNVLLPRCRSY